MLKVKNLIIIAHSLGAFLASHLVPYIQERILAIFLVGPAGFTSKSFSKNETEALVEAYSKKWDVNNS